MIDFTINFTINGWEGCLSAGLERTLFSGDINSSTVIVHDRLLDLVKLVEVVMDFCD
jgi:hypothetical protein